MYNLNILFQSFDFLHESTWLVTDNLISGTGHLRVIPESVGWQDWMGAGILIYVCKYSVEHALTMTHVSGGCKVLLLADP